MSGDASDGSSVGEGGLEPPHPFGHRNLNPPRLPIPPLAPVRLRLRHGSDDPIRRPGEAGVPTPGQGWWAGRMFETMGLQQFEDRLERLVEGTLAKPFRSNLQPVEIGRRLTREMDLHRRVGVRGLDRARLLHGHLVASRTSSGSPTSSTRWSGSSPTPPENTPGSSSTPSWARSTSRSWRVPDCAPGGFTVTAEVIEGPDGRWRRRSWCCPTGGGSRSNPDRWSSGACRSVRWCVRPEREPTACRGRSGGRDRSWWRDLGSTNGTRAERGARSREQYLASGRRTSPSVRPPSSSRVVTNGGSVRLLAATTNYSAIIRPLQWVVGRADLPVLPPHRAGPCSSRSGARPADPGRAPAPEHAGAVEATATAAGPAPRGGGAGREYQGATFELDDELTVGRSPGCGVPTT